MISRSTLLEIAFAADSLANLRRIDKMGFKGFLDNLTRETGQPISIMSELLILCGLELQTAHSGSALESEIKVHLANLWRVAQHDFQ